MKTKKPKKECERIEDYYEGENGAPWVTWYKAKEAEGWQLESATVTKQITQTRFRGKVCFRREVQPETASDPSGAQIVDLAAALKKSCER